MDITVTRHINGVVAQPTYVFRKDMPSTKWSSDVLIAMIRAMAGCLREERASHERFGFTITPIEWIRKKKRRTKAYRVTHAPMDEGQGTAPYVVTVMVGDDIGPDSRTFAETDPVTLPIAAVQELVGRALEALETEPDFAQQVTAFLDELLPPPDEIISEHVGADILRRLREWLEHEYPVPREYQELYLRTTVQRLLVLVPSYAVGEPLTAAQRDAIRRLWSEAVGFDVTLPM